MLAKSFNVQLIIAYILLGIVLLFRKKWLIAFSCFLSAIILFVYVNTQLNLLNLNSASSSPLFWRGAGGEVSLEGRGGVALASFNVRMYNTNYQATINSALATNADVIAFEEINKSWANALEEKLKDKYPYYKLVPQEDLWGIGVFSKHPIQAQVIDLFGKPSIAGWLLPSPLERGWVRGLFFIALHAESPETYADYLKRNEQFELLASILDTVYIPKFIMGDFNATPWDAALIHFKKQTQLQDSRKNLSPTFPTFFSPAMIPLDYIFHSPDIECIEFKTVENGVSDHKGITGKYLMENSH